MVEKAFIPVETTPVGARKLWLLGLLPTAALISSVLLWITRQPGIAFDTQLKRVDSVVIANGKPYPYHDRRVDRHSLQRILESSEMPVTLEVSVIAHVEVTEWLITSSETVVNERSYTIIPDSDHYTLYIGTGEDRREWDTGYLGETSLAVFARKIARRADQDRYDAKRENYDERLR